MISKKYFYGLAVELFHSVFYICYSNFQGNSNIGKTNALVGLGGVVCSDGSSPLFISKLLL